MNITTTNVAEARLILGTIRTGYTTVRAARAALTDAARIWDSENLNLARHLLFEVTDQSTTVAQVLDALEDADADADALTALRAI